MDEDEMALVAAEEAEGVVDVEMTAAVAGEAPVLLREEGAIEAYTEARSEQQKQLEEFKAKVRRGKMEIGKEGGKARRRGGPPFENYVTNSSLITFVPRSHNHSPASPSLPPSLPPSLSFRPSRSKPPQRAQTSPSGSWST